MKELPGVPIPMWLVTHRDVKTSRRVRVVADFLAKALTIPARGQMSRGRDPPHALDQRAAPHERGGSEGK